MKLNISLTADRVICQGVNVQVDGTTTEELAMAMSGMHIQALLEDLREGFLIEELESRGYTVTKED
jgi:hypothetical protein